MTKTEIEMVRAQALIAKAHLLTVLYRNPGDDAAKGAYKALDEIEVILGTPADDASPLAA
jgi:hypothetical protein